jgi:hypothetical protein
MCCGMRLDTVGMACPLISMRFWAKLTILFTHLRARERSQTLSEKILFSEMSTGLRGLEVADLLSGSVPQ